MKRRALGRTGLSVTELGFGSAPLGNLFRPLADDIARATLAAAKAGCFGYFDTAPFYGFGLSERRLGDALRGGDFVVSTKVGRLLEPVAHPVSESEVRHGYATPMPFEPVFDYSYDAVMRSYRESLQRLGLARIDILYIHDIGRLTHGSQDHLYMAQLTRGGGLKALEELREKGAIAGFGVGVNEAAACREVMDHARLDVILLAGRYTLLEQEPLDDLFPACEEAGTAIVVGGPFNSGILAVGVKSGAATTFNYESAPRDVIEKVAAIEAVCDRHGVPLPAAALQFPLAHPLVASVIPGLDSPARVKQALALYSHPIPAALWRDLKAEGLMRAEAPVPA
ncbi:MAG: aldo/keto reductase [Alphaproteobacteria bacterium]|nr:aldo/keto reductase [Alphaproteobacteria bacterium]